MNIIIKKLLLAFSVGLFVGLGFLISYAVNITSVSQSISSGAIIEDGFFTDLQNRIINIYSTGSGGNVGIGISVPTQKLHVNGNVRATTFIGNVTGTASNVPWLGVTGRPTNLSSFSNDSGYLTSVADNRVNTTGDNITGNFNVSGNVGIGTTTPSYKLDVNGDILSSGWIRTGGNNGWYSQSFGGGWHMTDTSWIRAYNGKSLRMAAGLIGGDGGLSVGYASSPSPLGGAIVAGNVGIGTPSPTQKLDVRGSILSHKNLFYGVGGDSGQSPYAYGIYQEAGAWASPYPDLRIQYHTGIKYDAYRGYGGHSFYTNRDGTGNPSGLVMQITDKVRVLEGGIEFPNGTVQTTAANGGTLSIGSCYNIEVFERDAWGMCNIANNEVNVGVYQYTKDNGHIKILYVRCCKLSIN